MFFVLFVFSRGNRFLGLVEDKELETWHDQTAETGASRLPYPALRLRAQGVLGGGSRVESSSRESSRAAGEKPARVVMLCDQGFLHPKDWNADGGPLASSICQQTIRSLLHL